MWTVKPNIYAHGTAYVVDDSGVEIAFCQTVEEAVRIADIEAQLSAAQSEVKAGAKLCASLTDRNNDLEAQLTDAQKELRNCDDLRERLSDILTRTANALHGGPRPCGLWSWHDLPERAEEMRKAEDMLNVIGYANSRAFVARAALDDGK